MDLLQASSDGSLALWRLTGGDWQLVASFTGGHDAVSTLLQVVSPLNSSQLTLLKLYSCAHSITRAT